MTTSKIFTIFVLDDEPWYGSMIQHYLSMNPDYSVERFEHAHDLLTQLYKKPDVITVDFSMPDINGQEAMQMIKAQMPEVPIIIISGQEDIQTATSLLKDGAFDYILKDEETTKRLWKTLQHIHEIQVLKRQLEGLKNEVVKKYDFSNTMLGQSPVMQKVFELTKKAALTNITVSISGETGTGKELIAKAIHYNSSRSKQPFISVNLAAIPKDFVEYELFGYEKGAFAGAVTRRIGKFEEANNGTLFLDQISELDVTMQTKVLQGLQEKVIFRLGSNKEIQVDLRVIVATNENLKGAVNDKSFREDLYYRLLGLPIHLPPLKERGDDLLLLAKIFIDDFCRQNQLPIKKLSAGAQSVLMRYKFPGNVRELKSLIELAVVLCSNNIIEAQDINLHESHAIKAVIDKEKTLKEYEHEIVQHYLEKYEGNVLQVAEKLAIGKSTLYRMLKSQVIN
jgi:two-component system response regulator AtoC